MRVLIAASVLSVFVGLTSIAAAENVGSATRVQRFAYQTPPQAGRYPLYRLNPVVRNARLETVPSGALEVTFTDGSRLTLGSSSAVVVDNYVFAGPGGSNQTLKMSRGLFRFVSGSMPKDQVKLQTPSVTIGIRGTIVKVSVNGDAETIFFEHGEGNVTDGSGNTVNMREGDMLKVKGGKFDQPENKDWSAGDEAVDYGMNPFGQQNHGPDGGSGGGDGAGSSGGSRGDD
jgi:hypothetical protein